MADDPLSDALQSLVAAGADPAVCRRVLADVRSKWSGDCYIKAIDREARNATIQAELAAGESVREVAKKVNASQTTVRRVWRDW